MGNNIDKLPEFRAGACQGQVQVPHYLPATHLAVAPLACPASMGVRCARDLGRCRMRGRAASLQARAPLGTHGHLVGSGIGHHGVVAPAHRHRPWRRAEGQVQLSDTGQTSNTCYAEEGRLPGAHSRPTAHHRQATRAHHPRELIDPDFSTNVVFKIREGTRVGRER